MERVNETSERIMQVPTKNKEKKLSASLYSADFFNFENGFLIFIMPMN